MNLIKDKIPVLGLDIIELRTSFFLILEIRNSGLISDLELQLVNFSLCSLIRRGTSIELTIKDDPDWTCLFVGGS